MRNFYGLRFNLGFSIIEFFISLSIGVIIFSVLCCLIQNQLKYFSKDNSVAVLANRGILLNKILANSIHLAGFPGGNNKMHHPITISVGSDSQIIKIWRVSNNNSTLVVDQKNPYILRCGLEVLFHPGDRVLVSNYIVSKNSIIKSVYLENDKTQKIILKNSLGYLFKKQSQIYLFGQESFYLAKSKKNNIKILMLRNIRGEVEELTGDLVGMQVNCNEINNKIRGVFVRFMFEFDGIRKPWEVYVATRNI